MDGILDWGVSLIIWLQSLGSWLIGSMEFFSFLGNEEFYLIIAPAILWCWNLKLGLRMGLFLMISASFNGIFKMIFHGPRPYWIDNRVTGFAIETSFGVPSGHAQNAVIVWGTLAIPYRKWLVWVAAASIFFLIGLSRLVLGVHFPHDVLVGWIFGGILLWILTRISSQLVKWLQSQKTTAQLIILIASSLCLILLGLISEWASSNFYLPTQWLNNAAETHPEIPIEPFALSGLISNAGAFLGLAAGAIWLEKKGGFSTRGTSCQLLLRYFIGLLGVIILWFGLGQVFPRGVTIGPYVLRYVRYSLVGFWVTGMAPYLFRKLGLASGD